MANSKLTPEQKLSVIQPRLRRGDFSNLSSITGYDTSYVSRVLRGERGPNIRIVNEAYRRIGRRKLVG